MASRLVTPKLSVPSQGASGSPADSAATHGAGRAAAGRRRCAAADAPRAAAQQQGTAAISEPAHAISSMHLKPAWLSSNMPGLDATLCPSSPSLYYSTEGAERARRLRIQQWSWPTSTHRC